METIAQTTPRSLEVLLEHVRDVAYCPHCTADPGRRCHGRRGIHLGRVVRAYTRRQITPAEIGVALGRRESFTAATIIRAGAR